MAEETDLKIEQDKTVTAKDGKSPEIDIEKTTSVAPTDDKPTEVDGEEKIPTSDDISDVIEILNILDKEVGGTGEIAEIPDSLRNSLGFLVTSLSTVKDMWEDPAWNALLEDLRDQKEDGQTPSIEVAVARTIPLAKIQELAESEDYAGAQGELRSSLDAAKASADEEAMYSESFDTMLQQAEEYAQEMGYDEERKNQTLQKIFDILKIVGDGKLSKAEFAEFDKMVNYDTDTATLRDQLSAQGSKEVLPDKASVEAAMTPKKPERKEPTSEPGLGSMAGYSEPAYLKTGQGRFNKGK